MGRKGFDLSKYVEYNPLTNQSQCLHPNCGKLLSGKRNANIKRHYMLMHGINFKEYDLNEENDNTTDDSENRRENSSEVELATATTTTRTRKTASKWEQSGERAFISIWSTKMDDLRDCRKNRHILAQMVEELKEQGYLYTVEELRIKMHNLKSRYRRERRHYRTGGPILEWDLFQDMHTLLAPYRSYYPENFDDDRMYDSSVRFGSITTLPSKTSGIVKSEGTSPNRKACRSLSLSTSRTGPAALRLSEPHSVTEFLVSEPYQLNEEMAKLDEKVGFIGGGNMAFAIGSGLISRGIVKAGQVLASGPNLENLTRWRDLGAEITEDNYEVLDKSDVIFICVKPHILTPCATQLRSIHEPTTKDKEKLFVSVLAGVNLKSLEESFNFIVGLKMIRTMPNTPMQVGEGCTVYTAGTYVKQQDLEKVHLMLNSLGIAQQVPESMIDAVTGVAGCGPAYVFTFIESLADGAVKQGVPRQMALQFAAQTVLGAAKTVLMTGKHPAVLRDEVCSPGGSTIVGVHELEKGNFRANVMNAVEASSKRSAELGKK